MKRAYPASEESLNDSKTFGDQTKTSKNLSQVNIVNIDRQNPSDYKEYRKLKYKNKIYSLGEILLIRNYEDPNNDFLGILKKIMKVQIEGSLSILVEIQWYYRKSDLPKKYSGFMDDISESEVFLTDHKDITSVECINGICSVLSYEEYEALNEIPVNTFFTR